MSNKDTSPFRPSEFACMDVAVGIDIGYGFCKLALQAGDRREEHVFPSRVALLPPHALRERGAGASFGEQPSQDGSTQIPPVVLKGQVLAVGHQAQQWSGATSSRSVDADYVTSLPYRAMMSAALRACETLRIGALCLGLPVHLVREHRSTLLQAYHGRVEVTDGEFVDIDQVRVVAQPVGSQVEAAMAASLDAALPDRSELLVDAGYGTLDWLVSNTGRISYARSGSANVGMHQILDGILANLTLSSPIQVTDSIREKLDQALLEGKPFRLHGQAVALAGQGGAVRMLLDQALSALVSKVGDAADLDRLVLCGGAARFYAPGLRSRFPGRELHEMPEGRWANVRGFLRIAQDMLARRDGGPW